ncbi:hypothetical protein B0H13DRAFT_2329955 [Mycena leptocephala]|nr:hypothetical protein B0H13DRAFT_2329955 [Mycena leptocephala]
MSSTKTNKSRWQWMDRNEDQGPEECPLQRPRLNDETRVEGGADRVLRDTAFHRDDGDCILRMQDTLFKVHRHLFNYELSAFHDLFSLPRPEGEIERDRDNRLIVLSGDTPTEVRAFFWLCIFLSSRSSTYADFIARDRPAD